MNKIESVSKIMIDLYKKDNPEASFITCVVGNEGSPWNNQFFVTSRKEKTKKDFKVAEIIPTEHREIPSFSSGIMLLGRELSYSERTGMFKVVFSDGSFMYMAKWFAGIGRNRSVESVFATEGKTWVKFLSMSKKTANKKTKPKIGVYRIKMGGFMNQSLEYEKFSKLPNNHIFHDQLPIIQKNINYYFDHVSDFMRFNQAGRRTLLLYGEPGTSKTSTLYKLALEHGKNKSVVFATDIDALYQHFVLCEKYSVPTLGFFEDCESALGYNDSNVKNFLSGIHARQNKGGSCIVYTTNYPERIEDSIKERPERIDELHYIGPISGQMLVDCARFYFGKYSPKEEILQSVLIKAMTGAEVKLFVENTLRYCASHRKSINRESMLDVLGKYREDVKQLQKFSEGKVGKTFVKSANKGNSMGFVGELDN
jgi:hypothetical protein